MAGKYRKTAPAPDTTPAASADGVAALLALTIFLTAALGSPVEEMLQDTLKSLVVSFGALLAAMLYFFSLRKSREPLQWHAVVWLPLLLTAYALGSMAWSHAYLGGVEAVRWFVFAVLLWLGLNTLSARGASMLAWGIHLGGVVASLWTALQFYFAFSLFPQGPNPASTFVNRNFFAEYAVCTLPFAAWLLARAKAPAQAVAVAAGSGLTVAALLMTGTRSGLLAMWLLLFGVFPLAAWRFKAQFEFTRWPRRLQQAVVGTFLATVVVLGLIPSGNAKILEEERGTTALARGIGRTGTIRPGDASLGVRMLMWKATARVIEARPLTGVGAGAWESEVPLYQDAGSQLETDYYVHNEFLQLVAEYGIVGWVFIALLLAYLAQAALRTWKLQGTGQEGEAPLRSVALATLFALFICSSIGFPWRLAATGAMFALCLGLLAASDARLGFAGRTGAQRMRWQPDDAYVAMGCTFACLAVAVFITNRAVESEAKLVTAARLALTINASGEANSPRWDATKERILSLTSDAVRVNRHYRKLTPVIADEMAQWGDWRNATAIWESVLGSRPNVVAIITNAARGYSVMGQIDKAQQYLERAKRLQPAAPAVRSLEVIVLTRQGKEAEAFQLAKRSVGEGVYDYDLLNAGFTLGVRARDYAFARKCIELRMQGYPITRAAGHMQLGQMYHDELKDTARALEQYKLAVAASPAERAALLQLMPVPIRAQVEAAQTSSSSK